MRENSIRFEFVVLRASDIVIQTPFGTPSSGSPVGETDASTPRVRGAGRSHLRFAVGRGTSLTCSRTKLLDLDLGADGFELLFHRLGIFLGHRLLDGSG